MTFQSCMAPKSMMSFEEFLRKDIGKCRFHMCVSTETSHGYCYWLCGHRQDISFLDFGTMVRCSLQPCWLFRWFMQSGYIEFIVCCCCFGKYLTLNRRISSEMVMDFPCLGTRTESIRITISVSWDLCIYLCLKCIYILYVFIPFVVPFSNCLDNKMCWKKCSGDTLVRTPGVWIWTVVMVMQIRETMKALNNQKKLRWKGCVDGFLVDDLLSVFFCQGFLWVFFVFVNL